MFVATALGMVAVCLLLPRPRTWAFARLAGAVAASLALAGVAVFAARTARLDPETFLFYAFAGIAVLSGGVMITRTNPARAALSFALVILSTTGLFLLQAASFLMAGTIIVYAGAIVVTFLFVIMLAQPQGASDADQRSREPLLSCVAGFFLLATLLFVLRDTYSTRGIDALSADVESARSRDSLPAIREALGDQAVFVARLEREVDRVPPKTPAHETFRAEADAAGSIWSAPSPDLARKRLDGLAVALADARSQIGRLQPSQQARLSAFAGRPANRKPSALPAENVAAVGRALFSDYLLAVEIAGTLLLVATVGAIAIAQRPAPPGRAA
jgi:NADH:ubiquinone oxidoreductase subunit 6 (subunit J)